MRGEEPAQFWLCLAAPTPGNRHCGIWSCLAIVELTTASCVQDRAFPLIADGKSVLMASHTGSGKTLAYLLPLVTRLRKQEDAEGFVSRPKRPRVLVLSPTRELAEQIGSVAKQLAHFAKFRSAVLSAGAKCGYRA
jgi:superfamily II DNA/RNA helicase